MAAADLGPIHPAAWVPGLRASVPGLRAWAPGLRREFNNPSRHFHPSADEFAKMTISVNGPFLGRGHYEATWPATPQVRWGSDESPAVLLLPAKIFSCSAIFRS